MEYIILLLNLATLAIVVSMKYEMATYQARFGNIIATLESAASIPQHVFRISDYICRELGR